MISFSSSSIAPASLPASTINRISSSVTSSSSSSGLMPRRRSTPFVDTVRSHTMGAKSVDTNETRELMGSTSLSAFFIANLLGTSSPRTSVKYDSIRVMSITAIVSMAFNERGSFQPDFTTSATILSEKFSAAKALARNPERVIAT